MAKHLWILSTIWFTSLLVVLLSDATTAVSESGEIINDKENHNSSMIIEQRTRRDVLKVEGTIMPNGIEEDDNNHDTNNTPLKFGPPKELHFVKRAPNGFTGMRGKKEYSYTDYGSSNDLNWSNEPLDHDDLTEINEDINEDNNYGHFWNGKRLKKAPTAFYGVRGKKYEFPRLDEFLRQLEEDRLRETLLQDFLDRLAVATVSQNEMAKRAPTGFTGMRGKRPAMNSLYGFDDSEMGKRAPSNAFVGVRGKKDVDDHKPFKRSPMESYNTRVKGQRFVDFSNKFVAVRGKKSSMDDISAEYNVAEDTQQDTQIKQLAGMGSSKDRFLVNILPSLFFGGSSGKRAPSGFVGMRGKRAANNMALMQ